MAKTKNFEKTEKQKEQVRMLSGPSTHCLSYGGSRSAKTFGICRAMIIRAAKTPSRHLATRLKFNHCKTSLFMDTFPKVFSLCFPDMPYEENRSDWFYKLPNGSEIWCGGLDEKKRVEKILGKEYSTIFFNEVSQIPYGSVTMALTRLAEKNDLKNKAYYDCNPPGKKQWVYPLFIRGLDPDTWEPLEEPHDYSHIRMNPRDNLANIDPNYIKLLSKLPEKDRLRFLEGEFTDDAEGNIYYNFSREKHVKPCPRKPGLRLMIGMDFNVDFMAAVICQIEDDKLYVIDEVHPAKDTPETCRIIKERYPGNWTIIPDSTGRNRKSTDSSKSDHQILKDNGFIVPNVRNPFRVDRYNCVNNLFEKGRLFIDPRCKKLIRDLESIAYKEGTSLPDVRDKSLGHITDSLGYIANWAFPIVESAADIGQLPR